MRPRTCDFLDCQGNTASYSSLQGDRPLKAQVKPPSQPAVSRRARAAGSAALASFLFKYGIYLLILYRVRSMILFLTMPKNSSGFWATGEEYVDLIMDLSTFR